MDDVLYLPGFGGSGGPRVRTMYEKQADLNRVRADHCWTNFSSVVLRFVHQHESLRTKTDIMLSLEYLTRALFGDNTSLDFMFSHKNIREMQFALGDTTSKIDKFFDGAFTIVARNQSLPLFLPALGPPHLLSVENVRKTSITTHDVQLSQATLNWYTDALALFSDPRVLEIFRCGSINKLYDYLSRKSDSREEGKYCKYFIDLQKIRSNLLCSPGSIISGVVENLSEHDKLWNLLALIVAWELLHCTILDFIQRISWSLSLLGSDNLLSSYVSNEELHRWPLSSAEVLLTLITEKEAEDGSGSEEGGEEAPKFTEEDKTDIFETWKHRWDRCISDAFSDGLTQEKMGQGFPTIKALTDLQTQITRSKPDNMTSNAVDAAYVAAFEKSKSFTLDLSKGADDDDDDEEMVSRDRGSSSTSSDGRSMVVKKRALLHNLFQNITHESQFIDVVYQHLLDQTDRLLVGTQPHDVGKPFPSFKRPMTSIYDNLVVTSGISRDHVTGTQSKFVANGIIGMVMSQLKEVFVEEADGWLLKFGKQLTEIFVEFTSVIDKNLPLSSNVRSAIISGIIEDYGRQIDIAAKGIVVDNNSSDEQLLAVFERLTPLPRYINVTNMPMDLLDNFLRQIMDESDLLKSMRNSQAVSSKSNANNNLKAKLGWLRQIVSNSSQITNNNNKQNNYSVSPTYLNSRSDTLNNYDDIWRTKFKQLGYLYLELLNCYRSDRDILGNTIFPFDRQMLNVASLEQQVDVTLNYSVDCLQASVYKATGDTSSIIPPSPSLVVHSTYNDIMLLKKIEDYLLAGQSQQAVADAGSSSSSRASKSSRKKQGLMSRTARENENLRREALAREAMNNAAAEINEMNGVLENDERLEVRMVEELLSQYSFLHTPKYGIVGDSEDKVNIDLQDCILKIRGLKTHLENFRVYYAIRNSETEVVKVFNQLERREDLVGRLNAIDVSITECRAIWNTPNYDNSPELEEEQQLQLQFWQKGEQLVNDALLLIGRWQTEVIEKSVKTHSPLTTQQYEEQWGSLQDKFCLEFIPNVEYLFDQLERSYRSLTEKRRYALDGPMLRNPDIDPFGQATGGVYCSETVKVRDLVMARRRSRREQLYPEKTPGQRERMRIPPRPIRGVADLPVEGPLFRRNPHSSDAGRIKKSEDISVRVSSAFFDSRQFLRHQILGNLRTMIDQSPSVSDISKSNIYDFIQVVQCTNSEHPETIENYSGIGKLHGNHYQWGDVVDKYAVQVPVYDPVAPEKLESVYEQPKSRSTDQYMTLLKQIWELGLPPPQYKLCESVVVRSAIYYSNEDDEQFSAIKKLANFITTNSRSRHLTPELIELIRNKTPRLWQVIMDAINVNQLVRNDIQKVTVPRRFNTQISVDLFINPEHLGSTPLIPKLPTGYLLDSAKDGEPKMLMVYVRLNFYETWNNLGEAKLWEFCRGLLKNVSGALKETLNVHRTKLIGIQERDTLYSLSNNSRNRFKFIRQPRFSAWSYWELCQRFGLWLSSTDNNILVSERRSKADHRFNVDDDSWNLELDINNNQQQQQQQKTQFDYKTRFYQSVVTYKPVNRPSVSFDLNSDVFVIPLANYPTRKPYMTINRQTTKDVFELVGRIRQFMLKSE